MSKEAKVITIMNNKGGVGKSFLTFNLAYTLAKVEKKKVLVIDIDHQYDLSAIALGEIYYNEIIDTDENELNKTLCRVFMAKSLDEINTAELIAKTKWNFDIIPSSIVLNEIEYTLITKPKNHEILNKFIKKMIAKSYDYIIIDCPPSLNLLVTNAVTASDKIIIPTEMSRQGDKSVTITSNYLKSMEAIEKLYKIILIKYDKRLVLHKEYFDKFEQKFGEYLEKEYTIGKGVSIEEAMSMREPIIYREPTNKFSVAIKGLGKKIIKELDTEG